MCKDLSKNQSGQFVDSTDMFCPKCSDADIVVTFVSKGKVIDSSSIRKVEDEFSTSREYDFYFQVKAKVEHLRCICRRCSYRWREHTAQNK